MKQKKTGIKIKHRKYNLYNKRKSKTRRVLTVAITIVAACALGVVGYGLGKPIVNYIRNKEDYVNDSTPGAWTPPESASTSDVESTDTVSEGITSETEETNSTPQAETVNGIYMLPAEAAANSTTLNSALAAAKESGCSAAAVTLKDEVGYFYYKSEIDGIKDSDSIVGTLTAAQIADSITKAGLTPAARISTLMDSLSPRLMSGGYNLSGSDGYWLDASAENGGKQWLSPFKQETVKFIGDITSELSAAGFTQIICTNTRFPSFYASDISTYLYDLPLTDSEKRVEALWNVVNAAQSGAEKNGAALWLQIEGDNLLAEVKDSTDAEVALDTAKIAKQRVIAYYPQVGSAGDAYNNAKTFATDVKAADNNAETAILVKSSPSGAALENAKKAFTEAGLDVFYEN